MSSNIQEILSRWREFMVKFRGIKKAKRRRSHRKKHIKKRKL